MRRHMVWLTGAMMAMLVAPAVGQETRVPGGTATQPAKPDPTGLPEPDVKNARYGPHERNVLDVWKAKTAAPAPLMVFIHGGGFRGGDKNTLVPAVLQDCRKAGIAVAAINYRYSEHAPFPAQMLDSARAIQFIRLKSKEWNIDPKRIAATGGSAGAGISLWLGFHDDLADPKSDDPVLRQSSRLTCMAVRGAQSTYDPRWMRDNISPATGKHPVLYPFYGIKEGEEDSERAHKLYEQASPITYLTKDDPPVWLIYDEADAPIPADAKPGTGIHHPKFGKYLKEKMDALGIECALHLREDFQGLGGRGLRSRRDMMAFLVKHLKPRGAEN
jgi:acetyl esterase